MMVERQKQLQGDATFRKHSCLGLLQVRAREINLWPQVPYNIIGGHSCRIGGS